MATKTNFGESLREQKFRRDTDFAFQCPTSVKRKGFRTQIDQFTIIFVYVTSVVIVLDFGMRQSNPVTYTMHESKNKSWFG